MVSSTMLGFSQAGGSSSQGGSGGAGSSSVAFSEPSMLKGKGKGKSAVFDSVVAGGSSSAPPQEIKPEVDSPKEIPVEAPAEAPVSAPVEAVEAAASVPKSRRRGSRNAAKACSARLSTERYAQNKNVNSSLYVGYVEDEESIDAIMKKFEAMEQIRQQKLKAEEESMANSKGKGKMDARREETVFNDNDLQKVFKQTSMFTVKMLQKEAITGTTAQYREFTGDYGHEFSDLDDSDRDDDDINDDSFWDNEMGKGRKGRRGRSGKSGTRAPRVPAEKRQRPEHRPTVVGKDGQIFAIRKRIKVLDPTEVTFVRIPNHPIPESWCLSIAPYQPETPEVDGCEYYESAIFDFDLKSLDRQYQAILMDPPWHLDSNVETPKGRVTVKMLDKLRSGVDKLLPFGLIFIWIEKELTPDVVFMMSDWGFNYVENLVWAQKQVNNKFVQAPSPFFCRSKMTLLIFRKQLESGDIELRHQRSPDVVFDTLRYDPVGVEDKPDSVYRAIETMLPHATYQDDKGKGQLLQLWSKPGYKRKGWTMVSEGLKKSE